MSRKPIQRIQDSVHGLMEFRGMETIVVEILRTPELQRLRRIRQLGLGYLVFPGAEHSRLCHSLGAAYLALKFGRQLEETCRDFLVPSLSPGKSASRDLAVAALCHDLGHGPLSHAWEREVIGEGYNFEKWSMKLGIDSKEHQHLRGIKWHELIGHAFLTWPDGQLHQLLESHEDKFSTRVGYLLRGQYYLPYIPRLLSSDVDVDRADFLRRDTHQSGVAYGRYDLDWLISTCAVGQNDQEELVVGFDKRKAVRVIEQFLIARQALYDTVYHHKTVRSAEGMVGLFLRRLKEVVSSGGKSDGSNMARPYIRLMQGEVLGQQELLALDDFSLWVLIETMANAKDIDDTVADLGKRILARDLFKMVPVSSERITDFLRRPDAHSRIYKAIQPFCVGKADYYLAIDTVKFKMLCEDSNEVAYLVDDNRRATPLRDHDVFRTHTRRTEEVVRMYTIAEALEAVRQVVI